MTREDSTGQRAAQLAARWIDEAFQALAAEDFESASRACVRAEAVAPGLPDTLHLRGALAEAHGDEDQALHLYEQAAAADAGFASPRLAAAGLRLDRGDDARAIELAREAVALAEGAERAEALLVCAEIAASQGKRRDTRAHLIDAADTATDPGQIFAAAEALLEIGDTDAAESAFRRAGAHGASEADVRYALGLVAGACDDHATMVEHFLEVARLDRESPPDYHLSEDEFEACAERALAELPPQVIDLLENVPVLLDEAPSDDLIREGIEPRLLGLFTGIPLPHKSHVGGGETPHIDAVHLYRRNLEREYREPEELIEQIRITVLHETAHFFGLEDEDLHKIGLG
jgi:predicted Zn-dependent protease with MMP-like domain/Tfp pilus assembly protein PilF